MHNRAFVDFHLCWLRYSVYSLCNAFARELDISAMVEQNYCAGELIIMCISIHSGDRVFLCAVFYAYCFYFLVKGVIITNYKMKSYGYNELIPLDVMNRYFETKFIGNYTVMQKNCIIKTRNGQVISTPEERKGFKLNDVVFDDGSRILKLLCTYTINNTASQAWPIVTARLSNYLVVLSKLNISAVSFKVFVKRYTVVNFSLRRKGSGGQSWRQ